METLDRRRGYTCDGLTCKHNLSRPGDTNPAILFNLVGVVGYDEEVNADHDLGLLTVEKHESAHSEGSNVWATGEYGTGIELIYE